MSDSTAKFTSLLPPDLSSSNELLQTLLDVSLTGVVVYTPIYDSTGEVVDFAFAYLNLAAQQMLKLPPNPPQTYLMQFPQSHTNGSLAFHRDTFLSGEPGYFELNYQADGYDNYFRVSGRRVGTRLLVSFTDIGDQSHTVVEQALRESQAREQAARAEADLQRQQLHNIFMQAPAMICIFEGPNHIFKLVNPPYQQLVGERPLLGKPIAEAMPELAGQPIFGLLDKVYRTGESFYAHEMLVQLDHDNSGDDLGQNYYNFIYQATRNLAGDIDGILVFAYEVTAQVQARRQVEYSHQQVQDLYEELQAINEELQATNEEILATNSELLSTQQALQQLNEELEARVTKRTREVQRAQAEAERQRARLERFFMQAPAAICILDGSDLFYELVNPAYQQLFPGRQLLGKPLLEALPEIAGHTVYRTFREVYETGITHEAQSLLIPLARPEDGVLEDRYFNYIQQARIDENGYIDGVLVFAFEVTEQVKAQQRAEALQAELLAAAQRQVQDRETFYQVFEQTPAAICIQRGPEHRYEYYNAAYQQFFPDRELQGRPLAEALPETVTGGFVALLDGVYQTGKPYFGYEMPLTIEQPDGASPKQIYFTFTYQAYWENGQIVGISTFAYDVTEQVLARQEADRQRRLLHTLFMEAPAPIVILDGPELVYKLVNPAYQQIFPGRALLDKALLEALPELVGTSILAILNQVYQTGETFVAQEMPLMLARHEGGPLEEIYWTFTYQARRNEQRAVDGIMVFAYEVTDQVMARRVVEQREQYFRQMADNVPAMLWVTDPEGYCTYLNQQWFTYTGQTEAEALGVGWVSAVHPDDAEAAKTSFLNANAHHEPFHQLYRLKRHDGRYRWAIDAGLPRFNAAGEFEGIVGTVIDVHEQKLAEQSLRQLTQKLRKSRDEAQDLNAELRVANEQLKRTNVDLDNFIYTASHDLKAPILNIEGLMDALLDVLPPASLQLEPIQRTTDLILDSVQRFKRTIDHLTEITKLQKENSPEVSPVNLAAVIAEVQLDLAPVIQAEQAQIDVDATCCPTIRFSAKNLRSIIYNLLSNAIKYRSPERAPFVRVHCHESAEYQVLSVQDNGLGIDLAQQDKLFAMFKRLHNHVEGSGIGLYMVKKIIENAGGKIEVQSKVGEGSIFQVYFRRNP